MRAFQTILLWLAAVSFPAAAGAKSLNACGSGQVTDILSPSQVKLAKGDLIQIAAIKVVPDDLYSSSHTTNFLSTLLKGKDIVMTCEGVGRTVHGVKVAHITIKGDNQPVSHSLIGAGVALYYPEAGQMAHHPLLQKAEDTARRHQRGLWAAGGLTLLNAQQVNDIKTGQMAYVVGKIVSVYKAREWVYLNFGENYKSDFTIRLKPAVLQSFLSMNGFATSFKDKEWKTSLIGPHLMVRGLVHWQNGPMITLSAPQRLQFVDPK